MKFAWVLGVLLLAALPVKADEFADARVVTIFGNATSAEAFDVSVEFDNTTQTLLLDGVQTTAFGSLGAFSFAGFTVVNPTQPNGDLTYFFNWDDSGGDTMTLIDADTGFLGHWAKLAKITGPNVSDWSFLSTDAVSGGFFDPPGSDPAGDPPSPTPEPSSLILLGLGLVSAVFMSRKLITS